MIQIFLRSIQHGIFKLCSTLGREQSCTLEKSLSESPGGQFGFIVPQHFPAVMEQMADLMVPEEMKMDLHWMLVLEYSYLDASIGFTFTTSEVKNK